MFFQSSLDILQNSTKLFQNHLTFHQPNNEKEFTTHQIDLKHGDLIYMFSDGYIDQIGGPENKRYLSQNIKNLLQSIRQKEMKKQKQILIDEYENWKKDLIQV